MDGFRDECGVVGVFGVDGAARVAALALHALQHRGQEAAGIAVSDGARLRALRGRGLVNDVLGAADLDALDGRAAIGHVRYSTSGDGSLRNVQPFVVRYAHGQVAIAHNGTIVNAARLRRELEAEGSIFSSTSDTEVVLHLVARSRRGTFINRLVEALYRVEGAYSFTLLTEGLLVAVRDPWGFRPLAIGRLGEGWIVASETCAIDLVGGEVVREVDPGEMIIIDRPDLGGVQTLRPFPRREPRQCVFEHIYFARPDSRVFGRSVYEVRVELGRRLAREHPARADVVVPVPDSGVAAALGYARESGIPYEMGLLRSHYVGRTFIEPTQRSRDLGVRLKLSPVRSVLEGLSVVVVDDSIVRGTTSRKIVRMVRGAGAREVHLRITSPPTRGSCFYGIDTPTREELIAHRLDIDGIRRYLGADSLGYLSLEGLRGAMGESAGAICDACFSGDYPVLPDEAPADAQVPLFGTAGGDG